MRSQITLGKIHGIRIGLHYSWFLIALLLLFSLYVGVHRAFPQWHLLAAGGWAVLTTALFFLSLLLHELSHSLLALRYGLHVREITLFALGGVSQIEGDIPSPASEFKIAIAGPLTSAAIGIAFLAMIHLPVLATLKPLLAMFLWLGYINLILAAFNLLPGYPMDGGRILRAILWFRTGNLERATRTAATAGTVLAFTLIAVGIIDYFRGSGLGGLWTVFLGWFLLQASRESRLEMQLKRELQGVRVSDLMVPCPLSLDGSITVQDFVDRELLRTGRRCFVVNEGGAPVGILTLHDLRRLARTEWARVPVHAIMRPLQECRSVEPDTPLLEALSTLAREDLNQLTVLSRGRLEGLLSRAEILAYLQMRAELNILGMSERKLSEARDVRATLASGSPRREEIQSHAPRFRRWG